MAKLTKDPMEPPENAAKDPVECKLVTLRGINWEQFKVIESQLEDKREIKLSYLAGVMEIMSPIGKTHEYIKSTLGLLLEAYMRSKNIRFYKRGGFTLEELGYAYGTPDESYCIGNDKEIPDIAIEIIVTSGTIDRRELYEPTKVPEVWFWKIDQLRVFHLQESGEYEEVSHSQFFPDLDLDLLVKYMGYLDQYDAVNEFVQVIRND
jgi:Uma2 family endonuclease